MYSSYIFCIRSSRVLVTVLYQQMCIVHFSHGFMSEGGGTNGCSGSIVRARKQNLFQPPKKNLFLPYTNQTRLAQPFWSIEAEMSVIFHFCYGFSHIHLHL